MDIFLIHILRILNMVLIAHYVKQITHKVINQLNLLLRTYKLNCYPFLLDISIHQQVLPYIPYFLIQIAKYLYDHPVS